MTSTLAKQINSFPTYKYKVVSFDSNDSTYFLEYIKQVGCQKSYCWCRASQILRLQSQVEGYLSPPKNKDDLPTLMVS